MRIKSYINNKEHDVTRYCRAGVSLLIHLCLLYVTVPIDIHSQEQGNVTIDNYTPLMYKNGAQNWSTVQDSLGKLYFGNESGVMSFDGLNWRLIELSNQSSCGPLCIDNSGRIYVGGIGDFGYLVPGKGGKSQYVSLLDKVDIKDRSFDSVWHIKCFGNDVYFVTDKMIFRLRDGKIKTWKTENRFKTCFVVDNHVYTWEAGKGISEIRDDSLFVIPYGSFFKNIPFNFVADFSGSKLLIGTYYNGLFTFDFSSINSVPSKNPVKIFHSECDNLIKKNILYTGTKLSGATYALGMLKSGIIIIDTLGNITRTIDKQSGLQNDIVHYLYEDKEGSLWASLNKGISRIDIHAPVTFWSGKSGMDDIVSDIIRYNGAIFIGDFNGLSYLQSDKVVHVPTNFRECLSFFNFKAPGWQKRHALLMGMTKDNGYGVFELEDFNIQKVLSLKSSAWVFVQSKIHPGRVYIGTSNGLWSAVYSERNWFMEGQIGDFDDDIRSMVEDANGDLWLGTNFNGVIKITPSRNILKPENIIRYKTDSGIPSLFDLMIFSINNKLLLGTQYGLFSFSETANKFLPDSTYGKTLCDGSTAVYKLVPDYSGNIWIAGTQHKRSYIAVAKPDGTGKYRLISDSFRMIPDMTTYVIYPEPNGNIWIGGSEGVFLYKGSFNESFPAFKALIRTVAVSPDSIISMGSGSQGYTGILINALKYNNNSLSFQFTAATYYNVGATEYQTYLEGFDKGWNDWTRDNKREYTNLTEGDYKFHVRARNVYRRVSDEATFQFEILPPWYRTNWAYTGYIVLLLAVVYLIVFLNGRRLKKANLNLEELVIKRTREIIKTNLELAKQKEEITTQRDQLKELNSTKDRFFSIIAHDLKNPFNSILGLADLMKSSYGELDEKEMSAIIDNLYLSSHNAYELLRNLLEWSMSQLSGIEFKPQRMLLSVIIEECIGLINFSAKEKKITILNWIDEGMYVYADTDLTKTVLRNLLANAVKFSNPEGRISIYGKFEKNFVKITIEDNGIGIRPELIGKLFRRDTKSTTPGTANERGTGLGLILCKEFVEKQGGQIHVESEYGKYSKFIFTLPV